MEKGERKRRAEREGYEVCWSGRAGSTCTGKTMR